jgi:hypothetical protein
VKLEGSLDAFSLPDVFQLLSLTKKSGGLHLTRGSARGVVHFASGAVGGAVADDSRQGLARRLVGMDVVDDAALRRAVERVVTGASSEPVGVARALVEAGAVDVESVRELAREHVVDAVFDLLRWPEGDFAFAMDEANPDDVGLRLPADEVVAEAVTRARDWESVSRVIPSPSVVLTVPVVLPGARNGPEEAASLTSVEWALLALVDGSRSVGELVEVSGAGQFAVVSTLASLVHRGLLALRDADAPDHASVVRRRQAVLAPLEAAEPVAPGTATGPVDLTEAPVEPPTHASGATQMVAPLVPQSPVLDPAAPAPAAAAPDPVTTEPAPMVASVTAVPPASPTESVVPTRPDFLPRNPVEYPEQLHHPSAGGSATRGGSAVGLQPAGPPLIERDPSVNRSLMLRLIAGVRGL